MKQVNLLPKKYASLADDAINKILNKFFIIVGVYVIICTFIVIGASMLTTVITRQQNQAQQLSRVIAEKYDIALQILATKKRIAAITTIIAQQYPFATSLQTINQLIVPGITLDTIAIDRNGDVEMTIQAIDSTAIASFSAQIQSNQHKHQLQKIQLDNAYLETPGAPMYKMGVSFILPPKTP